MQFAGRSFDHALRPVFDRNFALALQEAPVFTSTTAPAAIVISGTLMAAAAPGQQMQPLGSEPVLVVFSVHGVYQGAVQVATDASGSWRLDLGAALAPYGITTTEGLEVIVRMGNDTRRDAETLVLDAAQLDTAKDVGVFALPARLTPQLLYCNTETNQAIYKLKTWSPNQAHMIQSDRLDLILLTPAFWEAAIRGDQAQTAELLGVPVPADFWPVSPYIHDRLAQVRRNQALLPWLGRAMVPAHPRRWWVLSCFIWRLSLNPYVRWGRVASNLAIPSFLNSGARDMPRKPLWR